MLAKDTVLSDMEMMDLAQGLSRAEADHAIANKQADISFKAGEKQGYNTGYHDGYEDGEKARRKGIEC